MPASPVVGHGVLAPRAHVAGHVERYVDAYAGDGLAVDVMADLRELGDHRVTLRRSKACS